MEFRETVEWMLIDALPFDFNEWGLADSQGVEQLLVIL